MNSEIARYCIRCGTPTVTSLAFGAPLSTCPVCGWVFFNDPKVAVAAFVEQDGKVLLARRINEPFRGAWTLPAGFVNAHEDPKAALEREVLEETGLEVKVSSLLDVLAGREHERGADILIVYRAQRVGGSLRAGDDADQVAFFSLEDLPPLAFESTHKMLGSRRG